MFRRSVFPTMMLFLVLIFIYQCQLPQNPADPSNTRIELLLRNSLWTQSNLSITDTVGKPIQIGLVINLPENIDSIRLSVTAEGKALFDTLLQTFSSSYKDTIWKAVSFADTGYKLVSIVPYSKVVTLVPASAGITIVKKTSTTQPDNNSPKWTEKTLNVALNDTARYELDLSSLCSDPDKDALNFAISGNPLPGDTIINNRYVFRASTVTIGKNSVELIASDPSGLKDTMDLVLNITISGNDNSPPEVTIIAPDRDSSVINAGHYVVDMLCSDASGIDSVYAVFNGKTTSAVLENGHYKIAITGLVVGIYNVIELTVRDKSINALKTTKTIKIKYAQGFTITYDGNGNTSGAVPIDTGKYETGATATVKGNSGNLVKTGFVFAGWNTAADGSGTAYADGASLIMGTKDVTLFARWTQNATFTVSYDGNSNTSGTAPSDAGKYETGSTVTVKENTGDLAKTGFTFAGWNTAADGSGTAYAAGATFKMSTANVTLFARWTQNPTFTVTYDGNTTTTGTVPSDAGKHETGTSVTVKGNTGNLVKTGFTFAGWNTAADGSGTDFNEGSTFKMGSENITLFAQWNPTYSVTYDGNTNTAGTVPSDSGKYEAGSSVTVKLNTGSLVKTGFTFAGWNTAADGSGTGYAEGSTFKMGTGNVTLFARWTQNPTYAVTYDANTGTGTVPADVNKYETGAVVTVLDAGTLVKKGYTFTGWNTLADGSGTARASATTFNMAAINVTLYAQWKLKQYTVTYIGNGNVGGSVPVDANQYDTGSSVIVLGNTGGLTKTGYTFDGWNTAENGSGTSFVEGTGTFVISSNTTLFAKWKIKTYTLSYAGNGNTGGTAPVDVALDSNALATVAANTGSLSKTGFDFNGWNTGADGSGTALASGATFRIKSDTTLYAQWTVKKYTLTISAPVNGTVNLSGNVSVDSNVTTTITATAASGFRFKCWRVTSGLAIITDTTAASTSVKLTQGNATIKAVFGCFTFEIVIDDNITPNAITQGNDGNYYFVSSAGKSPVVKKLDPQGNVISTKTYGYGIEDYMLNSIKATSDGSLIMGGTTDGKLNITKISQNLNILTSGSYDIEEKYETLWGCFAFETKSGSYILGGGRPASIIKMQSIGGTSQTYYGVSSSCEIFTDGQEVNDGGLIFTGDDRYDFDIIKTDANGKLLWENTYPDLYRGNSIRQTSDGGFIAGGSGMSSGLYCDGLIKISSTGTALWQKINPLGTGIKTVRQTADGGFVYVSNTQALGNGENDIYLVKTDSKGEVIWNKTFGTSSNEYVRGMELTKDGGFIILGGSDNKCYVIKTDENGNVEK